jgi:hypothetical protein
VLNLSDKVKILDLLKGSMSLAEAERYKGKNELSFPIFEIKNIK